MRSQVKLNIVEARESLGISPRPNQIEGAELLAGSRSVVELATGEGKTLMAAMAAGALVKGGTPVHVFTANEYLASRDAEWMRPFYSRLGISVAALSFSQTKDERRHAYSADIVYASPEQFCFDFLNDKLAMGAADYIQPKLASRHALIDEADAVLLDMARLPFTLVESSAVADDLARGLSRFVSELRMLPVEQTKPVVPLIRGFRTVVYTEPNADYVVDAEKMQAWLTEHGYQKLEAYLAEQGLTPEGGLYSLTGTHVMSSVSAALRATLFRQGVHYLLSDNKLMLIDDVTGRPSPGRMLGEGVHQAIEAREGLPLTPDSVIRAAIPLQDYLTRYKSMSGMTGTAWPDKDEFSNVYRLKVKKIQAHSPCIRVDEPDRLYPTRVSKLTALFEEIRSRHGKGQPLLVNLGDTEDADLVSRSLTEVGVSHALLTARDLSQEASVIANAGGAGAVTLTVNLAGRGTDILLGGADGSTREQVLAAGGLRVIGGERSLLTRVDSQLRGRAGRQGDPGSSVFFASLDDPLFTGMPRDKMDRLARMFGGSSSPLGGLITRLVSQLQRRANGRDSDVRLALMRADTVLRSARTAFYAWRQEVLEEDAAVVASFGDDGLSISESELNFARQALLEEADIAWAGWLSALPTMQRAVNFRAAIGKDPQRELAGDAISLFERLVWTSRNDAATRIAKKREAVLAESVAIPPVL